MAIDSRIEIPDSVKGLIFDCDGTLVDSMTLHMEAWADALRSTGSTFDYEFFFSKKGMKEEEIVVLYNIHMHKNLDPGTVVEAKHAFFRRHLREVRPIEKVVDVVYRYKNMVPMAVV
ncbi:MAG: hypothetical protein EHM64_15005, partial [Ignavibacteriae bacterium]